MSKKKPGPGHNSESAERLRSIISRVQHVEEEQDALRQDKNEIYSEARNAGFDCKTIRAIIRELKMSEWERNEQAALLDLYKAALGMLDGTPLGRAAVDKLNKKPPPDDEGGADADADDATADEGDDATPENKKATQEEIDTARAEGRDASAKGQPVTSNPYPALDPRRSSWDEGWCSAAGTDGMEIPDAWRRSKKPDAEKKGDA